MIDDEVREVAMVFNKPWMIQEMLDREPEKPGYKNWQNIFITSAALSLYRLGLPMKRHLLLQSMAMAWEGWHIDEQHLDWVMAVAATGAKPT